jgi:DNA-binding transcriptional LysR family regulator
MLLIGAPDHPAVRPAEVPFRALAGVPLAMQIRPNALVTVLLALGASRGIELDVAFEGDSPAILADAVANAGLCMISPRNPFARELAAGTLRAARIVNPVIAQTTWLAVGTQRPATAAVRLVARLIRELAAELIRSGAWVGSTSAVRRRTV